MGDRAGAAQLNLPIIGRNPATLFHPETRPDVVRPGFSRSRRPGRVAPAAGRITIVGMEINSVTPAVPDRGGELAWLERRLEQLLEVLDGHRLHRVRVWCTPRLVERLQQQWLEDPSVRSRWPHAEFHFMPVLAEPDGGYGWFDDRTFELDVITDHNELLSCHGLAYPGPVPVRHVETRWVLQVTDGMDGDEAEAAAALLN